MSDIRKILDGLDMALPETQNELVAYERKRVNGDTRREYVTCDSCEQHYATGDGHHQRCPKCHPGVTTFEELLTNENFWPGRLFVFDPMRGARGRWRLIESTLFVEIDEARQLCKLLENTRPDVTIISATVAEIRRLRRVINEMPTRDRMRAEQQSRRAYELADKLTTAEAKLDAKRAECDRLRDELAEARS